MELGRLRSLDGLRGVAAFSVAIHHTLLVAFPQLRDAYGSTGLIADPGTATWWLTYTPLHLAWLGAESVFVFLILSGLVLVLPVLRGGFSWIRYYPARALRLLVPVWASLALAGVLTAVFFERLQPGVEYADRPALLTWSQFVHDGLLLGGVSHINGVLWSLQWELWFSLLLPAYVAFAWAGRGRGLLVPKLVAVVAVAAFAQLVVRDTSPSSASAVFFLSMFAAGGVIAAELETLSRVAARMSARTVWPACLVLVGVLMCAPWLVRAVHLPASVVDASPVASFVGAIGLVVAAVFHPGLRGLLETPVVQWLGKVSFSLYLSHAIVLEVMSTFLPSAVVLVVGVPVSLVVAVVFFRLVEGPTHRVAHRVKQAGRRPTPAHVRA